MGRANFGVPHTFNQKKGVYIGYFLSLSNITHYMCITLKSHNFITFFFVKIFAEIKDFNIWGETFQRSYFLGGLNYLNQTLYKPIKKTPKDLNEASL